MDSNTNDFEAEESKRIYLPKPYPFIRYAHLKPVENDEPRLPHLMGLIIDDELERLEQLPSAFAKIKYLEMRIADTGIDRGLELLKSDCYTYTRLFPLFPAWQGIWDALHGSVDEAVPYDDYAHDFGVRHYENYLVLNELKQQLETHGRYTLPTKKLLIKEVSDTHLRAICELANEVRIFLDDITVSKLRALFSCTLKEPILLRNNQLFAYLLGRIENSGYLHHEWQAILGRAKSVKGIRGAIISNLGLAQARVKVNIQSKEAKTIASVISRVLN